MITTNPNAVKALLDQMNPTQAFDLLRSMLFGSFARAMPVPLNGQVPLAAAVDPWVAAAAISLALPDDAKAAFIFRAYGRTGTATAIELTPDVAQTGAAANPAANHIGISPNGDIVFHGADAWTDVDVLYLPLKYDTIENTVSIAASAAALPQAAVGKALLLLEAELLTSSVPAAVGKKIVDGPGTAPGAGHAALDISKGVNVAFNAADAVTGTTRLKLGIYNVLDLNTLLETLAGTAPAPGFGI